MASAPRPQAQQAQPSQTFSKIIASVFGILSAAFVANNATAKDTLTVYTYESFTSEWGAGPIVEKAFEASCDCNLEFVALDSSAGILNRVQLEGNATRADLVLGLDTNLMGLATETGLLEPSGVDTSALALPIEWTSDVFVPFDYGYFAFVYNTELMDTPPASFEELINAPDDVKIIIQDPRTSTPGLGLMLWMKSIYGDEAAAKWEALQPKILTVTKGWSEAYFSLFLNNEAPMVLSYSTSPGYHIAVDETEQYQAAEFSEGHYLQVEVAALLKSSKNKALAREFLAFMLQPEFQESLPLTNVMYPATDIGDALPDAFDQLITPVETLLIDTQAVKDNRKAWTNEWLDATTR